ncbi:ATPase, T2SS/T4P/T4SS family [Streptomyces sp. SBT349]|uniref:CpaF family protein n=1 Tax=Streptomyces sp. SBT349 TaxID=1580539 RepID=UPI00099D59E5
MTDPAAVPVQVAPTHEAWVEAVAARVADRLAQYAHARETAGLPPEDESGHRESAGRLVADELERFARAELAAGRPTPEEAAEAAVAERVLDRLLGAGVLERLLADPQVENILVNGADRVWLRCADGSKRRGPAVAGSDAELIELVRLLGARSGVEERRFDRGCPSLSVRLPDGSRMFAAMAVTQRVSLSIRKHRFATVTLRDLVRLGVCDEMMAGLLAALVRAGKNIIVAGGTNVGKTTFLRALASEIPPQERLVTIEDTLELGLDQDQRAHPDVVAMQAREANVEGQGAVDQAELVRWGLRMAPDRVIVGEIRGAEVVPMCNAMSQGNDGSLSTIHSSTSRGVFTKLAAYAAQSPERLSLEATNLMVAAAVHFVIHLGWDTARRRVVDSIREVLDADGVQVVSNEVFRPGPDGRAVPGTPLRSETLEELAAAGLDSAAFSRGWWAA